MKKITTILLSSLMITFATAQKTKTYYDNGQLKEVASYNEKGEKTSFKKYRKNGQLSESFTPFSNDKYLYKSYDFGVLIAEVTYNKSKIKEGEMKLYYNTGELEATMNFANNLLEGTYTYFFKNGKTKTIENYKKGLQEGLRKTYFENGKIRSSCNYKQNKEEGEYNRYSKNGQLEVDGNYKNGKEIGQWKYYNDSTLVRIELRDENANISEIQYYKNEKLVKTISMPKQN